MAVDKNLFLYDLAVVGIMKNEEHYIKEWLDYYLLAGVDHFYIYDNDSTDRTKEVMQPYIDAGVVTYTFYPGPAKLMEAYNDAIKKYKFQCRYMSFIDSDEFILPVKGGTISEVADEFFAVHPNISGVDINWRFFGSNNLEEADYSRGLLDRFTRRAANDSNSHKTLTNPRRINYMATPHYAFYFDGCFSMNRNLLNIFPAFASITDRIVMHHYYWKSHEEYTIKANRGTCAATQNYYNADNFKHTDNDVYDDSIIKYRDARRDAIQQQGGGWHSNKFSTKQSHQL